jgi:probable rRNA maturation factor
VTNESGIEIDVAGLAGLAAFMIPLLRLHPMCELSVTAVDSDRMSELHLAWMDEPGPTDVLSFPMDELRSAPADVQPQAGMLGDIVLCPGFAAAQASQRGRSLDAELAFLVVHGLLHLIGYDHATTEEYDAMFALQDDLLAAWREQVTRQSLADGMSR